MKRLRLTDFPELQRVLRGYLHEDFLDDHPSAAAALRSFRADADDEEWRRFSADVQRFLDITERLDFKTVKAFLARLGCRWTPPSRDALVELLTRQVDRHGGDGESS